MCLTDYVKARPIFSVGEDISPPPLRTPEVVVEGSSAPLKPSPSLRYWHLG